MKLTFLTTIFLFVLSYSYAQNTWHKCGFDHAIQQLEQQHPGYKQHIDAVFDEASRMGQQTQYSRAIHTIPVAVHVVWKTANEKLSECTISEQLEILNEDFRRQNADASNLRPIFNSIAADTEIEFRLDTIIWTQSNVDFASLGPFGGLFPDPTSIDSVKGTSMPLDPDQYLNIWVLNLGAGGLLGYAYPPDSLPNWPAGASAPSKNREGVVLHYEIVGGAQSVTFGGGFGGPPTTINTQGRTAVHEVGHYLGLRHIWGDGTTGGLFPQPSCSVDDGVGDTPNCLDRSEFDCDTTKNSCDTSLVNDMPDMVENYMDYSSESCMNTFTVGQKNLMKGVLNGPRAGLSTAPVKIRPDYDAIYNAQTLAVSTGNTCTSTFAATNVNASVSIPDAPCMSTIANDVWFSFTATSSDLLLEVSSVVNVAGTSPSMAYELFEGTCDSLVSLSCGATTGSDPLSGLTAGTVYYLRVYSMTTIDNHNFDICLRNNNVVAVEQIEQILNQSVHLSPNPTTGNININIDNNISFEGFLTIKNMLGQNITPAIIIDNNNRQYTLSLNDESNGLYLVEIRMNNYTIIKKVVLQK